jgi:universal stress protein A
MSQIVQEKLSAETEILGSHFPEDPPYGRLHVRSVLCPVDFSEFSRRAFQYATSIARHFQARLYVQHTVRLSPALFMEGTDLSAARQALESAQQGAEQEIRQMVIRAKTELPEVFPLVGEGEIRERIQEAIREHEIDLVVMGSHGHKGFSRLVLGSVAEYVVHEAPCPVLVVSHPRADFVAPEETEPVHLKNIVLATDFSPSSDRALAHALRWASEWGGQVFLFHAVEKIPPEMKGITDLFPEYNPTFERQVAEAWEKIHHVVPEAARKRCEVSYEVRHGHPKEEILSVAEEKNADLIVMGARGLGRSGLAWGSTISGVVRDGRFPVLAIRH